MTFCQISSGNGPAECELAVARFFAWLRASLPDCELLEATPGSEPGTFRSVSFKTGGDVARFAGTIQWVCKSPYRPGHRRKNWFISVETFAKEDAAAFDESRVRFQTMRAGGPGGQNVNKVETAVRATYLPDGFTTVCQDERSQALNRKKALERIKLHILEAEAAVRAGEKNARWTQHNSLTRGNPVVTFRGEDFEEVTRR